MTKKTGIILGGAVGVGLLLAGLAIFGNDHVDKKSPDVVNLLDARIWTVFGDAAIDGNLVFRNKGGSTGFASVGALFKNIIDSSLDNSVPYVLHLVVKGLNGAKKLGITAVQVGEIATNVNTVSLSGLLDISDGATHTLDLTLPMSDKGIEQVALHFGENFGAVALGNPTGSGIQVTEASVTKHLGGVPPVSGLAGASSSVTPTGLVQNSNLNIVSTGNNQFVGNNPTEFVPLLVTGNTMNLTPLQITNQNLAASQSASNVLSSLSSVEQAAAASHVVTAQ